MRVTLWGTRGSVAAPGPETERYGGNTSCVAVEDDGWLLVLDAGTGIRRLGLAIGPNLRRVDLLLTHLHLDHIQGLGFFAPLFNPEVEAHIWGPASTTLGLGARLTKYLSPPLFPVHLRDLPCRLELHEVPCDKVEIGPFSITSSLVCHPGPTVGYRIENDGAVVAYLPDHEPALGTTEFPVETDWTSGFDIAQGADLLIHDAQYTLDEYDARVGWGHSSLQQAIAFATAAGVAELVPFHHDPTHSDLQIDRMIAAAIEECRPSFRVTPGEEGRTFLPGDAIADGR
jgi:phosphoribosyl 1,2-cyclic phosphodiesterase